MDPSHTQIGQQHARPPAAMEWGRFGRCSRGRRGGSDWVVFVVERRTESHKTKELGTNPTRTEPECVEASDPPCSQNRSPAKPRTLEGSHEARGDIFGLARPRSRPILYRLPAMISISNLEKSYGDRVLFGGVSLQLNAGERYGLVGANGSGKSTFLSILCGDLEATDGQVAIPNGLRVGVLRQDHYEFEKEEILGVALMGNPELWDAMVEKEQVLANAETDFDAERFSQLEETVQLYDGYTAEARAATILEGLGIPTEVHRQPLSTLSGGFKLRVLLAQVLASKPDILFLDEPTNHLDILSIRWLEGFLKEFTGPAVVISHDHRFLDNISSSILDVDYDTVTMYKGNYTDFVEGKASERERREKDIVGRKKEIAHQMQFVDRFKAKASKARQAQSKLRMIERKAESITELAQSSRRYPNFRFQQKRPSGKEVVTIEGIRKSYGDKTVLHGVDLKVMRGDRMAIMGPNGIGKSTLLKILMGEVEQDAGTVEWGYETHPGYFAQDHKDDFEGMDRTAETFIWDYCPDKDIGWVRGAMALMLFTGQDSQKRLRALSGGEAARLVFSKLMLLQPNVLILDEPTNHLDLESIEALVEGLKSFQGTLILVSHDRWFVGQLATRVVEVSVNGIQDYLGTYEEYVHFCGDDHLDVDRVVMKAKREKKGQKDKGPKGSNDSRKSSGPDQAAQDARRRKQLEERAERLMTELDEKESRVADIDALFCQEGYYDRTPEAEVAELNEERAALKKGVAKVTADWEEVGAELDNLG